FQKSLRPTLGWLKRNALLWTCLSSMQIAHGQVRIPSKLQPENGQYLIKDQQNKTHKLTLHAALQEHLERYLEHKGNPIAAVMVADARTGQILAMVQGQDPSAWGSAHHSALFPDFPAASLFK